MFLPYLENIHPKIYINSEKERAGTSFKFIPNQERILLGNKKISFSGFTGLNIDNRSNITLSYFCISALY